ncbi:MAG: HEAT repeat domain-containing protein [Gemmatimonadaceae bacterium]
MTKLFALVAVAAVAAISSPLDAQSLASRIGGASDRSVQFTYPARPGVCGDGRTFISTSPGNFYGSYSTSSSEQCVTGPVRVVLDLADRNVIAIRTYVGAATADAGVTNLGNVSAAEAADYLLGVASRADGRVGRDAIFAALLGEGVEVSARLLDIGRDQARPLETRRAALSALVRSDARQLDRAGAALVQIATNENDVQSVRSTALAVLARLDHGAGIQPLIQLASTSMTSWVGRESMSVLAKSGDPRARQFLRSTAQRTDLPDEVLAVALSGLGREYVTGQDAALLRSLYSKVTGERSQNAILSALASLGGSENVNWITSIVRDERLSPDARRRALQALTRAGATAPSLLALYDPIPDPQLRESLISIYARLADKAATDKLIWIARNEQNMSLRRRAISALSRNSDPVVRQAMEAIVER